MFPKLQLVVLLFSICIFSSCSSKLTTTATFYPIDYLSSIDSLEILTLKADSVIIPSGKGRLTYDGDLQNFTFSLSSYRDSLLTVNLFSSFSRPISTVLFTADSVVYIDYSYKQIYELEYTTLSSLLGFSTDLHIIQQIFFSPDSVNFLSTPKIDNHFDASANELFIKGVGKVFSDNSNSFAPLSYLFHFSKVSKTISRFSVYDNYNPSIILLNYVFAESKSLPSEIDFAFSLFNHHIDVELIPNFNSKNQLKPKTFNKKSFTVQVIDY